MSNSKNKQPNWFDKTLLDFQNLVKSYTVDKIDPAKIVNMALPSGRILHNPAKRRVKDASRWSSQQVSNAVASSADWLDGLKNPARDPIAAALDAELKWENNMKQAIADKAFRKGLTGKTLADITSVADALGTTVFEAGIKAREAKITSVVGKLQPLTQAVSDAIQAMPEVTDADREKRLLSARRLMKTIKGKV